jgi:integration host factor subunit beta
LRQIPLFDPIAWCYKELSEIQKKPMTGLPTITKKDAAKRTAKIFGEKIYYAEKVVDGVFTALRQIMSEANPELRIEIRDFGVFEVKKTKPKPKARNPKTGEIIYVPARRKTHFKAGKKLREVLKREVE